MWSGPPTPQKKHKNSMFLNNTGPEPLETHKTTKPVFNVGSLSACQRNAISVSWMLCPIIKKKKEKKNRCQRLDPSNFLDPCMSF